MIEYYVSEESYSPPDSSAIYSRYVLRFEQEDENDVNGLTWQHERVAMWPVPPEPEAVQARINEHQERQRRLDGINALLTWDGKPEGNTE